MSETAHEKTNTENDEEPFPVSEKRIIAGKFIHLISKIHSEEKIIVSPTNVFGSTKCKPKRSNCNLSKSCPMRIYLFPSSNFFMFFRIIFSTSKGKRGAKKH